MIEELQTELEKVLAASFKIVPRGSLGRTTTQQTDRVQVLWAGIDESGRVIFTVSVIVAQRHKIGDKWFEAWNLVRASERFAATAPADVRYGEPPIGGDKPTDYATFTATSAEVVDVAQDAS